MIRSLLILLCLCFIVKCTLIEEIRNSDIIEVPEELQLEGENYEPSFLRVDDDEDFLSDLSLTAFPEPQVLLEDDSNVFEGLNEVSRMDDDDAFLTEDNDKDAVFLSIEEPWNALPSDATSEEKQMMSMGHHHSSVMSSNHHPQHNNHHTGRAKHQRHRRIRSHISKHRHTRRSHHHLSKNSLKLDKKEQVPNLEKSVIDFGSLKTRQKSKKSVTSPLAESPYEQDLQVPGDIDDHTMKSYQDLQKEKPQTSVSNLVDGVDPINAEIGAENNALEDDLVNDEYELVSSEKNKESSTGGIKDANGNDADSNAAIDTNELNMAEHAALNSLGLNMKNGANDDELAQLENQADQILRSFQINDKTLPSDLKQSQPKSQTNKPAAQSSTNTATTAPAAKSAAQPPAATNPTSNPPK